MIIIDYLSLGLVMKKIMPQSIFTNKQMAKDRYYRTVLTSQVRF